MAHDGCILNGKTPEKKPTGLSTPSKVTPEKLRSMRRKLRKATVSFIKLFLVWFIFLCLGSLLFIYVEQCLRDRPRPLSRLEKAWKQTCQLVHNNTVTDNNSSNSSNNSNNQTMVLRSEIEKLCNLTEWNFQDDRNCQFDLDNFAKYLDYTYTIAFTIGFGHIVPYSDLGKIITMIYAVPAIALTVVLYAHAADTILIATQLVTIRFEMRVLTRADVYLCKYKTCFTQIILTLIGFVTLSVLGIFGETGMNLNTLDSFYFSFISLTTIGFGDIVYESTNELRKPWIYLPRILFFLASIATLASTVSAVGEVLKRNELGKWVSKRNKSSVAKPT